MEIEGVEGMREYGQVIAFVLSIGLSVTPLIIGMSSDEDWYPSASSSSAPGDGANAPNGEKSLAWAQRPLNGPSSKSERDLDRDSILFKNAPEQGVRRTMDGWTFVTPEIDDEDGSIHVRWENGWHEGIEGGIYTLVDVSGQIVVSRTATSLDRLRLHRLVDGDFGAYASRG